jgi:hypothetical protein
MWTHTGNERATPTYFLNESGLKSKGRCQEKEAEKDIYRIEIRKNIK